MKRYLSFNKLSRITQSKQFNLLFSCSKKIYGEYFSFRFRENNCLRARLGVIVTKKNQKRAVQRNHLKRVVRESFRNEQYNLIGMDIIVLVKRGAEKACSLTLRKDLQKNWRKISSAKEKPYCNNKNLPIRY